MLNQSIKSEYLFVFSRDSRDINMKCVIDSFWGGIYICFAAKLQVSHRYPRIHMYVPLVAVCIGYGFVKHRVSDSCSTVFNNLATMIPRYKLGHQATKLREAFPKRRDGSSRRARDFSFGENYGLEIRFLTARSICPEESYNLNTRRVGGREKEDEKSQGSKIRRDNRGYLGRTLKEQLRNSIMFSRKFMEPPRPSLAALASNGSAYQVLKSGRSPRCQSPRHQVGPQLFAGLSRPLIYTSAARRNFVNSRRTSDRDPSVYIAVREGRSLSLGRSLVSRLTDPDTGRSDRPPDGHRLVGRSANRSLIHQLRLSDSARPRFLSGFPHPAGLTSPVTSGASMCVRTHIDGSVDQRPGARTWNRSRDNSPACLTRVQLSELTANLSAPREALVSSAIFGYPIDFAELWATRYGFEDGYSEWLMLVAFHNGIPDVSPAVRELPDSSDGILSQVSFGKREYRCKIESPD